MKYRKNKSTSGFNSMVKKLAIGLLILLSIVGIYFIYNQYVHKSNVIENKLLDKSKSVEVTIKSNTQSEYKGVIRIAAGNFWKDDDGDALLLIYPKETGEEIGKRVSEGEIINIGKYTIEVVDISRSLSLPSIPSIFNNTLGETGGSNGNSVTLRIYEN